MGSLIRMNSGEGAFASGWEGFEGASAQAASTEEASLITRAQAGDAEAFGVLVRLHQRQVYILALRMLRNEDEACEAAQEVFLAAWQGLRGFRGDARMSTWLHRITYNHCLKVSEGHRRDSAARAELAAESARAQSPANMVSASHARAAENEMRQVVREEIARLPTKYRAVLILRHLQDLSYEEMAEVMRVPVGTVKTQLFRARALLKERLEGLVHVAPEGLAEGISEGIAQGIARAGELRAELEAGLRSMLERGREHPRKGES